MKGMNKEELDEVLSFVQKHHKFAQWPREEYLESIKKEYHNLMKWNGCGMSIKYVDMCYDSRDASVWSITFRVMGGVRYCVSSNMFSLHGKPKWCRWNTVHELTMAFLKGELTDKQASKLLIKES